MFTVITGLCLAGKSTLVKHLTEQGYQPVVEYTTRPMRKGETDGVDYYFTDNKTFDRMEADDRFAETLHVKTVHGLFRYGAVKEDLKDNVILACGPKQAEQILNSGIPCLTVLLDIRRSVIMKRAQERGDNLREICRRLEEDLPKISRIKNRMDMILDAENTVENNVRFITDRLTLEQRKQNGEITGYIYSWKNKSCVTAQPMDKNEQCFWMEDDRDLRPYLKMKEQGMPKNRINQIAWLLLQGSGCGFCKTIREKPCNIKDGESCTKNIADYIRQCVHEEESEKQDGYEQRNRQNE